MSATTEVIMMWAAVGLYAASSIVLVLGIVFGSDRSTLMGLYLAAAGVLPHVVAIAGRWERVGHGPYLGFYEVVSTYVLSSILVFIGVSLKYRRLAAAGAVVMPIAFLVLGAAMFTPKSVLPITPMLASFWLTLHVTFAKLSYGSLLTAFGLAVLYLLRERRPDSAFMMRLPDQSIIDDFVFKLVAIGFVFLGIMIAAGAVWANESWGRYWGWDPIETWSLISWLCYALVLHLRLTMGWRGKRFMWAAMAALPTVVFALVGVAIVYESVHGAYLTGA